jgi:hypothetical protein
LCSPADFATYCFSGVGNDDKIPSLGVIDPEWVDAIAGAPPQYLAMSGSACDAMTLGDGFKSAHYRCCKSLPPLLEKP